MLNIRKNDRDQGQATSPPPPPPMSGAATPQTPPQAYQLGMRPGERVAPSVFGADLTIVGNMISHGVVQVDGEIQGDIHGTNIVVGEKARITGSIIAEEIVVRGHVMGSIRGKRVMLQSTSHVEGDVFHQALSIEQGAYFEGKSRRSDDPMAGAERPEIPQIGARPSATNGPLAANS
ncbi:MAG: polymer-forming cytoskeletal protein [Hyphomicrobiaceae bacterium]